MSPILKECLKYWIFIFAISISQYFVNEYDLGDTLYYTLWIVDFLFPAIFLFIIFSYRKSFRTKLYEVSNFEKALIISLLTLYIFGTGYMYILDILAFKVVITWFLISLVVFIIALNIKKT